MKNGDYQIYADELLYYHDPNELYKNWPPNIWQAIKRHEATPGMNELQVQFAIGIGIRQSQDGNREILRYAYGGNPVDVTFRNGKAEKIIEPAVRSQ